MLERIHASKNDEVVFSDLDWRLDVILSNESLGKVLQPEVGRIKIVTLKVTLSDGARPRHCAQIRLAPDL